MFSARYVHHYQLGYRLNSTIPMIDMNLVPVYQKYNITGAGVKILIIDDGIEYTHEDIRCNFVSIKVGGTNAHYYVSVIR